MNSIRSRAEEIIRSEMIMFKEAPVYEIPYRIRRWALL